MAFVRLVATLILLLAITTSLLAQSSAAKPSKKASGTSSLQATLEKLENEGWEAFKNRDHKTYTALSTSDYTAVAADGKPAHDLNGILDVADHVKINSYKLNDMKVTPLGPDAALATYTADVNLAFGNEKPQDMKLNVTDVYVKRGGEWKAIRYHESEIK